MKLTPIQNESELKVGKTYIRACINYVGHYWLELVTPISEPFSEFDEYSLKGKIIKKEYRVIRIIRDGYECLYHIQDLLGSNKHLFLSSPEIYTYLESSKDVFDFKEKRDGIKLNNEARNQLKCRWLLNKASMRDCSSVG